MRGLALNFASTLQVGNSAGISKVGDNKQLLIAIVVCSYFFLLNVCITLLISEIAFSLPVT
ncbi:MAG: hypothetical protein COZ16_05935 [Flavobacteriaceae bacterium CG_4_10_14_3_um_filter_31_253]|nr:MAG: hypothetical protein COW43_08835 [Flavobacteriaceae bacterium CG17_big_fil_post_rev_8_21_14_2_50_31_13]PIX11854.1 MAG: hypothetical protein COZ74_12885 [Flavobacteriaceae bacterium CG_4_8_14_3_um_filter_31_8]PIY15049.1 MAG: hypothetical protein COZ16_05935 [Flavobacteriaceae bacterium CG_4_10_14_3_um_filter_31_253]PIZ12390.1 MAG: hypothetical protein COY55_00005 [Flavobacteriaceae bacterium CG_4_10_14_0_8_um_filter_31_99]PJC10070.1 MAG: hypothetical protein CO067_06495 [Flavobacteriacea